MTGPPSWPRSMAILNCTAGPRLQRSLYFKMLARGLGQNGWRDPVLWTRASGSWRGWSKEVPSAPQPNRADLRQAQDAAPKGRRTDDGNRLAAHRKAARRTHRSGMRHRRRQCRMRPNLRRSGSGRKPWPARERPSGPQAAGVKGCLFARPAAALTRTEERNGRPFPSPVSTICGDQAKTMSEPSVPLIVVEPISVVRSFVVARSPSTS